MLGFEGKRKGKEGRGEFVWDKNGTNTLVCDSYSRFLHWRRAGHPRRYESSTEFSDWMWDITCGDRRCGDRHSADDG